jgi:excisionase family DNA binding protein
MEFQFSKKWYAPAEVAAMLGFGLSKTKLLIAMREIRSVKVGAHRRILPSGSTSTSSIAPIKTPLELIQASQWRGLDLPSPQRLRRLRMGQYTGGQAETQICLRQDARRRSCQMAHPPQAGSDPSGGKPDPKAQGVSDALAPDALASEAWLQSGRDSDTFHGTRPLFWPGSGQSPGHEVPGRRGRRRWDKAAARRDWRISPR